MTQDAQTLDAVLWALIAAVVGAVSMLIIPAIGRRVAGKLDNANELEKARIAREKLDIEHEEKRKNDDADDDATEEKLDIETRQLTNRLARVAFDREEQLSRLKSEYEAQSELLRLTRKQLEACKEVEVSEYRHQVDALLEEIAARENTIAKLRHDVAILEATR